MYGAQQVIGAGQCGTSLGVAQQMQQAQEYGFMERDAVPRREGSVNAQVTSLHVNNQSVINLLEELERRLGPVLRLHPPTATSQPSQPEPPAPCDLSTALRSIAVQQGVAASALTSILDRLEL